MYKPRAKRQTGRVSVYVKHSEGFHEKLRPCHDSAADSCGEMTASEASTLRSMIARYVRKCHLRHTGQDKPEYVEGY